MDHKTSRDSRGGGQEQKQRRLVVYPTQRSMSVVKSDSPRFIPHEPVRGAVSPLDKKSVLRGNRVSETATLQSLEHQETLMNKNERTAADHTSRIDRIQSSACSVQVSSSSDVSTQSLLPYHDNRHHVQLQGSSAVSSSNSGVSMSSSLQFPLHEDHATLLPGSRLMLGSSSAAGNTDSSFRDRCPHLKEEGQLDTSSEVTQLKEELEVLMKVNSDLKKLLVASIGDDLHYKVDALVRTKVQLANEIGDYTRKLVEDYEDLDKLSIQADLWYSKYQASRVLVEQLTSECDRLNGSLGQAQMALQYNIQERHELQELLLLARRNLLALVGSQRQSSVERFRTKRPHTLDLAIDIKRLTDTTCRILAGGIPPCEPDEDARSSFTPAELLTHQVLSSVKAGELGSTNCRPQSVSVARHPPILLPRFHPGAKYEGFTFSCCAHCKGEVFVL